MSREQRINERIRASQIRLIGEKGEQLGIVTLEQALSAAREQGLDLVEVAPTAAPPVCRLLDYGRFKYEQEKKEHEARKNQKVILLKEVRFRPKTDDHDLDFKSKAIQRFLEEGEKVKVTVRFRGREMVHPNIGRQVLDEVSKRLTNVLIERAPLLEGNAMTMILSKGKEVARADDAEATALTPASPSTPAPAPPAPARAPAPPAR